jgi:diaminopropionate ammonia-lyase
VRPNSARTAAFTCPKPFPKPSWRRLSAKGAEVVRSGAVYEDSIAAAIADAEATGAIHLADGSWPGYTEPPRLVMEGYTVMAEETARDLRSGEMAWPSHVYLQAGVGGMAAAVAAMIRSNWAVQPRNRRGGARGRALPARQRRPQGRW